MRVQAVVSGAGLGVGYLVSDHTTRTAMAIDAPPGTARRIQALLSANSLKLESIASTHGHWDSCADCAALVEATGALLLAHIHDATRLANPNLTLEPGSAFKIRGCRADRNVTDGDLVEVGNIQFTVMHTPGHTPGSICLYSSAQRVVFTGDLLLAGQVGATDMPGGNAQALDESLQRLRELPPATRVFPAHGKSTTIGAESWLLQLAG